MRVDRLFLLIASAITFAGAPLSAQTQLPILGRRAVRPNVAVKAWNAFGSMRLIGWDKDSIVMRGRISRTRRKLFAGDSTSIKVGAEGSANDDDMSRSDIVVYLPRRAMVAVKTVTADIAASNVSGWFFTSSGNVRLSGEASSVTVESVNGNLDLDVSTPWIKARTGDGHLLLRGAAQDADLSTVSGTLSIASPAVLRGQFSSVSGEIQYAAAPASSAVFEFSNHSGSVDLLLPQSTSAALTLTSITGAIENGFTGVRPAAATAQSMRLNLGRGEAQITVRSFKGPIRLRPQ